MQPVSLAVGFQHLGTTGMIEIVDDLIAARDALRAKGATILGTGEPRIGAHGTPIVFLHPKDMGGVLVELMETPKDGAH